MAAEPRAKKRAHYDDPTRISLLEDDADDIERRQQRLEGKLDSIRNWLVTGAISFASAAVLLGINIAVTLQR